MTILEVLDGWFQRHSPALEATGLRVSIPWGPADRNKSSAWLDFESSEKTARLILWSSGEAELTIGDLVKGEVLLEEHREIWTEVGLDDVEATVRAWLE